MFRQGAHPPYSIRWYGVTSLFGHFRKLIATAIAAESVDSRDWMRPLEARELFAHVVRVLGGDPSKATVLEALDRPLWIDFVADTGDDRDVSLGVGRMIFSSYTVAESPSAVETRELPRGDVLLFGGDTAYPVATADEIFKRVIQPWSEALREAGDDTKARVLLGIPGNHDWYDGLDGFARMFRRVPESEEPMRLPSEPPPSKQARRRERRGARTVGLAARQLHLDEVGGLFKLIADAIKSVRAFVKGVGVKRRHRLTLSGYEAVQEATYWALPIAPGLDMWGVDRQLGKLDYRQRGYFHKRRRALDDDARLVFIAPDPAVAFGERYDPGARMLAGCRLSLELDRILYLCGDMHHYERRRVGPSLHVIAGGGGAFLHGTRISPSRSGPAECAYPNAAMTRQLVAQVPLKLMMGRAGLLVHMGLAVLASIELGADLRSHSALVGTAILVSIGVSAGLYGIAGHHRAHPRRVAAITIPFGAAIGFLPMALKLMLPRVVPTFAGDTGVMLVYAMAGSFLFGLFLAVVAITGLEHQQAFAVLGHPGFKHFVRMCISPGGTIEAWVIGKDDVLVESKPVMIDRWSW